ncbi:MAG TPA: hypothetical protein VML55_14260 [Planctomycetaceae bacterium]|nr:hypothetical protein [Planctomycetaceae bacterium]
MFDLFVWQCERLLTARADASPGEVAFLTAAAETCRQLAESIAGQPPIPLDTLAFPELLVAESVHVQRRSGWQEHADGEARQACVVQSPRVESLEITVEPPSRVPLQRIILK